MARPPVIGDLRVQVIYRRDGGRSYTVFTAECDLHLLADSFLRRCNDGTDRSYAYLLVDHLRWLAAEGLDSTRVTLADLVRYMGAVGAKVPGPWTSAWRIGRKPYAVCTLKAAASCLKMFYLHQDVYFGVNGDLARQLDCTRLPTQADRNRRLLGHLSTVMPANPLAPMGIVRGHPKLPPPGATPILLETLSTARDRIVVTCVDFLVIRLCCTSGDRQMLIMQSVQCGSC
jgi:hypothetical protein